MSYLTKHVFTKDNGYHVLAGAGITLINVVPAHWLWWSLMVTVPLSMFAWGYVREVAQADNDWSAPLRSTHKLWESASWGVASAIAAVSFTLAMHL